jgi:hypothetical protein
VVPALKDRVLVVLVLEELKEVVTPVGTPETPRVTLLASPTGLTTLIVLDWLLPPTRRVRALAEGERPKLGSGMVSAIVVVFVATPEVPVTVTL